MIKSFAAGFFFPFWCIGSVGGYIWLVLVDANQAHAMLGLGAAVGLAIITGVILGLIYMPR